MRLVLVMATWLATGCYGAPTGSGRFRCDHDSNCPGDLACTKYGVCCSQDAAHDENSDNCQGFVLFDEFTFTRGCDGSSCPVDAQPSREIKITAFTLQDHEVTQSEYDVCVSMHHCDAPTAGDYEPKANPALPVGGLRRQDADSYCNFIGGRLPREAEWERVARGRGDGPYPWGNEPPTCELANYTVPGVGSCSPGGRVESTAGGTPEHINDMAGNVREWVFDSYEEAYYQTSMIFVNPAGPPDSADSADGVIRGGGFNSGPDQLRVWSREQLPKVTALEDVGVRCARDID